MKNLKDEIEGKMEVNKIYTGDCLEVLKGVESGSVDLIIVDPPYEQGFESLFSLLKSKLKDNGQLLWFVQPTELYNLPEKPHQILIWEEPMSPKPNRRKYREFLDIIAWYAYGDYVFNNLMWNLMNSRFNDQIIRKERLHKWEKPQSLIERLLLIHTNEENIVLDPFLGSGTTAVACKELGRNYIGIELSPEYVKIAENRLRATTPPLFTQQSLDGVDE